MDARTRLGAMAVGPSACSGLDSRRRGVVCRADSARELTSAPVVEDVEELVVIRVTSRQRGIAAPSLRMVCEPRTESRSAAARHGASNLRVYGSVARYDVGRGSDIDVLVDMEDGRSLLDLARLHLELEDLLRIPVVISTDRPPLSSVVAGRR